MESRQEAAGVVTRGYPEADGVGGPMATRAITVTGGNSRSVTECGMQV